jgi:(p)ppGpp synthase/HD superfamily hydrolase
VVKEIIDIVSSQMDLNIRSLDFWCKSNTFSGKLMVYIQNVKALNELIENLSKIDQVEKVERIAPE